MNRFIIIIFTLASALGCDGSCPVGKYEKCEHIPYSQGQIACDCKDCPYSCDEDGANPGCGSDGKCVCKPGHTGKYCKDCKNLHIAKDNVCCHYTEFHAYDKGKVTCKSCKCYSRGITGCTKDECHCKPGYEGPTCRNCNSNSNAGYGICCVKPEKPRCFLSSKWCRFGFNWVLAYCECPLDCYGPGIKEGGCPKGQCHCKTAYKGRTCRDCNSKSHAKYGICCDNSEEARCIFGSFACLFLKRPDLAYCQEVIWSS